MTKTPERSLGVGDRAPDFALPDQDRNTVALQELLAKGPVVLFFYPKDYTPVCTLESIAFREAFQDFQDAGATVVGISEDSASSHRSFCDKLALPFPLLTDQKHQVRNQFGARNILGQMAGRVTYVIDQRGIIRDVYVAAFKAKGHVTAALKTVRELVAQG